jgi:hypothetical protein
MQKGMTDFWTPTGDEDIQKSSGGRSPKKMVDVNNARPFLESQLALVLQKRLRKKHASEHRGRLEKVENCTDDVWRRQSR